MHKIVKTPPKLSTERITKRSPKFKSNKIKEKSTLIKYDPIYDIKRHKKSTKNTISG
jgi:hypothetical protein